MRRVKTITVGAVFVVLCASAVSAQTGPPVIDGQVLAIGSSPHWLVHREGAASDVASHGLTARAVYDYFVVVAPEDGEWQDPEVLLQLEPRAERITLAEGQQATVSLRLIER
jgi:hypothetical protein